MCYVILWLVTVTDIMLCDMCNIISHFLPKSQKKVKPKIKGKTENKNKRERK